MNLENKPLSLAKTKRFILAYLQEHTIIHVWWGTRRLTKDGHGWLSPYEPRALNQLKEEGYAEHIVETELPIWEKFPYTIGYTTHHHHTGYVYQITETGREKSLRKKITQTDEYQDWLIEHIEDDKAFHRYSQKIEERVEELQKMPYPEYLKTVEWKAIRAIVIDRAREHCQMCGVWDEYTLHVHHKVYSRRGYESLDDLVALCSKCHALIHRKPSPI